MFRRFSYLVLPLLSLLISCGDDDQPINLPPEIEDQTFTSSENVDDVTVIGTVQATDPEEGSLTFSITRNSDDLFEIADTGAISLATGKTLDFETATSHSLTISVSDGENSASATITINVTDVNENVAPTLSNQTFEVAENISDTDEIGAVIASDTNGDDLTFSITEDADELFEITGAGILSLLDGKTLDFETKTSHTITVQVSDGELLASATITVDVTDIEENIAPVIENQMFTVSEVEDDNSALASVVASDANEDNLKFSITEDADALFEITDAGVITLLPEKDLDFATASSHEITVQVSDAIANATAVITINVTEVKPFTTTWNVSAANESITIYVLGEVNDVPLDNYYRVNWGDGETSSHSSSATHTYGASGVYTVEIKANALAVRNNAFGIASKDEANAKKLLTIESWGDIEWISMKWAFWDCSNLTYNAIDNPDLSHVTDMTGMFSLASSFNGTIGNWDVGNVTNMSGMFFRASAFNQPLDNWDVSKVTDISGMFREASSFNQDLNRWDTNKLTSMISAFKFATSFDGAISNWDVSGVTNMFEVFNNARAFNQDIGNWDVSNVTSMQGMFQNAFAFNQDVSNWNVSDVTSMVNMFNAASAFSQDLSGWNTANVTNCINFSSSLSPPQLPTLGCFAP